MTAFLIIALGSASVLLLTAYARLRARAVTEYATAAATFFRMADVLSGCDDIPEELVDALVAMNGTIADKRAARGLLAYLSADVRWWDKNSEDFLRRRKVLTEFFGQHPELEQAYHAATLNWFLAITALSPLAGKLARLAMTEDAVEAAAGARARSKKLSNNTPRVEGPQPARA